MQEENPETEMRGRELPGGGTVVAVDSSCVVVAGSVSSDGEKGPERCYSVYLLPCLSSVFWLSSSVLPFFGSLFFFFVLVAVVLVVAHGGGGGGKLGRADGGWETGGSCCDGGSAAVLLLCFVFLPMSVSVFASSSVSHYAGAVIDDWEDDGSWRWLWWLWQEATVERETERKMLAGTGNG
jgi:hypothetical protein